MCRIAAVGPISPTPGSGPNCSTTVGIRLQKIVRRVRLRPLRVGQVGRVGRKIAEVFC